MKMGKGESDLDQSRDSHRERNHGPNHVVEACSHVFAKIPDLATELPDLATDLLDLATDFSSQLLDLAANLLDLAADFLDLASGIPGGCLEYPRGSKRSPQCMSSGCGAGLSESVDSAIKWCPRI